MSCASVWSLEDVRYNSQEFAFSFIGLAALSFRLTKQRLHRTTNVHINAVVRSLPNTARDKYASSLIHKNRSIGWERKRNSYLITYLLTPWSTVLLEKLTGSAASQEIPSILWNRKFITVLTSARHLSLTWANSIQSPQPPPTSWRSILILSSHLRLGLLMVV